MKNGVAEVSVAIPESQLSPWSNHGAQETAKRTHEAIRRVLAAHTWPSGMTYDIYLQGSYRNDTNIRGDSDVDLVLELGPTVRYNSDLLSPYDQQRLASSFDPAAHSLNDFRREALKALEAGFGSSFVNQGSKSIKVNGNGSRLPADVVVCLEYRRYTSFSIYAKGMTFWALRDKLWVINYPKLHYKNGAEKSSRTDDRYKRTVRMFKNARNYLESQGMITAKLAPSYFLECLFYNAPDSAFQADFQETYCAAVNWMARSDFTKLVCQNGQQYLFGTSAEQWTIANANALADQFVNLWNGWS